MRVNGLFNSVMNKENLCLVIRFNHSDHIGGHVLHNMFPKCVLLLYLVGGAYIFPQFLVLATKALRVPPRSGPAELGATRPELSGRGARKQDTRSAVWARYHFLLI